MKKNCVVCDAEFEAKHFNSKLCDPCKEKKRLYRQRDYKKAWRESKKPLIQQKECKNCGASFIPAMRHESICYCSSDCSKEWHRNQLLTATKEAQAKIPLRECNACKKMFKPSKDDPRNQLCGYECNLTWSKMKSKQATKERHKNITSRVCVGCEQTFMPNRYDVGSKQMQVYCDGECGDNHARQLRLRATKEKAKLIKPRICVTCKKTFIPPHGTKRKQYCNQECSLDDPTKLLWRRISTRFNRVSPKVGIKSLPYNRKQLNEYIVSMFDKPKWNGSEYVNDTGYSMDNAIKWDIDHMRPVASFNQEELKNPNSEDFKKCWALNNLQPLWSGDNSRKNNDWDGEVNA